MCSHALDALNVSKIVYDFLFGFFVGYFLLSSFSWINLFSYPRITRNKKRNLMTVTARFYLVCLAVEKKIVAFSETAVLFLKHRAGERAIPNSRFQIPDSKTKSKIENMTLDRKWEKFRGGPALSKQEQGIRVTINRKGLIYLSAKMHQALGQPKAVALYYSREDDSIAVQPAYERFIEHFQLSKMGSGYVLRASTFCRHYNIRVPNTERFLRPDLDNEGNLILNLRETVTVGGISRTRRKVVI